MKEFEVETNIQRAREQFPGERLRIISDNGPQFVGKDFTVQAHSAIAYFTPADKLAGRAEAFWPARRQKLAAAEARRRAKTKGNEVDQCQCCDAH
jgi:hypothetical protein